MDDNNSKQLEKVVKTNFKKVGDLIIEMYSLCDQEQLSDKESVIKTKEFQGESDYFYSRLDNKVHKATSWISYYFYDEDSKAHDQNIVYKVIATSDIKKYPELLELTVYDLPRASQGLLPPTLQSKADDLKKKQKIEKIQEEIGKKQRELESISCS